MVEAGRRPTIPDRSFPVLSRRNREFVNRTEFGSLLGRIHCRQLTIHQVAMKCVFNIRPGVGRAPQSGVVALIFGIKEVGLLPPVEMVISQRRMLRHDCPGSAASGAGHGMQ